MSPDNDGQTGQKQTFTKKEAYGIYDNLLHKWGKVINLVAPSTLPESRIRHFKDSEQLEKHIPETAKTLLDIGSGAGFPGLVLAIARTNLTVHLVESDTKKCSFLSTVSRETFTPVIIHNTRVENVDNIYPDVITARALASLTNLLGMTEKWWASNPDIRLILPKGEKVDIEIAEAKTDYEFAVEKHKSIIDPRSSVLVVSAISKRQK